MGNKVMAVGFGLLFGVGYFLPLVIPAGAIVLILGAVLVTVDK